MKFAIFDDVSGVSPTPHSAFQRTPLQHLSFFCWQKMSYQGPIGTNKNGLFLPCLNTLTYEDLRLKLGDDNINEMFG